MTRRLPLCALLSTTALAVLSLAALPAQAACVDDGTTVTCTGPANSAISNGTDDKTFVIAPGAAIGPLNGRAMTLSGDDQTVDNDGLIESLNNEAIRVSGTGMTIDNAGTIRALQDRAIRLRNGADNAKIINQVGGLIESKDQTIRADNDDGGTILNIVNLRVENAGTIRSTTGRAIQGRGEGTTVINTGNLFGGEEVIEGRIDFTLENTGTIRVLDGFEDADGVQFSSGRVDNYGLIQGSDDGIDIDEGTIVNHLGGIIRVVPANGTPGGNGIDADEVLDDPLLGELPAGVVTIENAGLIEGPKAVGVADTRTAAIDVINAGTLRGTSGVAIEFNPGMDASSLTLFDHSMIFGSVLMTDSDDTVTIGALKSGQFTDAFFDGRGGDDTVVLDGYDLADVTRFVVSGTSAALTLATLAGNVTGEFRNFEFWTLGGTTYSTAELSAVAPVPLPASLLLLGAAVLGLGALRRTKA